MIFDWKEYDDIICPVPTIIDEPVQKKPRIAAQPKPEPFFKFHLWEDETRRGAYKCIRCGCERTELGTYMLDEVRVHGHIYTAPGGKRYGKSPMCSDISNKNKQAA